MYVWYTIWKYTWAAIILSQKKFQNPKFIFSTFWTQIKETSHCDLKRLNARRRTSKLSKKGWCSFVTLMRGSLELSESIREYEKEKWDIKGWNMWEVSSYKGNSCNFLQQNYTCTNSFLVRLVCDRNQLLVSVLYQNENFPEFSHRYFIYFTKIHT